MKLPIAIIGPRPRDAHLLAHELRDQCRLVGAWTEVDLAAAVGSEAELILLDSAGDLEDALGVVHPLIDAGKQVIVLSKEQSPDALRAAMRVGCLDVLDPSAQREALVSLLHRQRVGLEDETFGEGSVIAVHGAHGGIGVTTIACALAGLLAADLDSAVVLFDLDTSDMSLLTALDIRRGTTAMDLLGQTERLDVSATRNLLARRGEFWVVPQTAHELDGETLAGEQLLEVITALRRAFTHVIIDLGDNLNELAALVAFKSHDILLVVDQDVVPLHSAITRLKRFTELGIDRQAVRLVVNRYDPRLTPDASEISKQLLHPVFATVSDERQVARDAQNRGQTVPEFASRTHIAEDLENLSRKLLGKPPKKKGIGWWLAR